MCGALLVDGALRFAFNIRVTLEIRQTLARGCAIPFVAYGIDATRRRIARVNDFRPWWLRCDSIASVEWVPLVPLVANTDWYVVSDSAVGIDATKSRTRVLTFS